MTSKRLPLLGMWCRAAVPAGGGGAQFYRGGGRLSLPGGEVRLQCRVRSGGLHGGQPLIAGRLVRLG